MLRVLDGFGGAANGSVSDAARTRSLRRCNHSEIELEHLEGFLGDPALAAASEELER